MGAVKEKLSNNGGGRYVDPAAATVEADDGKKRSAAFGRVVTYLSMLVALCALADVAYVSQLRAERPPWVAKEAGDGSLHRVNVATTPDAPWVSYQLNRWIVEERVCTTDAQIAAMFVGHVNALLLANTNGERVVRAANADRARAGCGSDKLRVMVNVSYVRHREASPPTVWEGEWQEIVSDSDGNVRRESWNAIFSLAFSKTKVALTDDPTDSNPYGMYIDDLNWARVQR